MKKPASHQPEEKRKTSIGGQALIEGLLMLGPEKEAIALRHPDGQIVLETKPRAPFSRLASLPGLRGSIRLVGQMVIGVNALTRSAKLQEEAVPEEAEGRFERFLERHQNLALALTVVFGLGFSIVLFILLPSLLVDLLRTLFAGGASAGWGRSFALSFVEGAIRMALFVVYLWLTRRFGEIKRVWMYHGAEHKTIACYEAECPLTVENARRFSRFHARCGTSFLFLVMLISILTFSLVGRYGVLWNLLIRLALLPVVAGLAYELIRLAGRYDNRLTRLLSAPGLALQRLTTAEPDDAMLEVAIAALTAVLPETEGGDQW